MSNPSSIFQKKNVSNFLWITRHDPGCTLLLIILLVITSNLCHSFFSTLQSDLPYTRQHQLSCAVPIFYFDWDLCAWKESPWLSFQAMLAPSPWRPVLGSVVEETQRAGSWWSTRSLGGWRRLKLCLRERAHNSRPAPPEPTASWRSSNQPVNCYPTDVRRESLASWRSNPASRQAVRGEPNTSL
jgi:hypothetical protein